jgi:ferric-dicitrate binding protein FerR (iron transport regulator)
MEEDKEISHIDLLISNYLSGNSTDAQFKELEQWIRASEANSIYFSQQKALWLYSGEEGSADKNERWKQLKYKIAESDARNVKQNAEFSMKRIIWKFRYAASVTILVGASIFSYFTLRPKTSSLSAQSELLVPYGSRSILTLPDGTKLWANSGSKITYNTGFGKNNRDVCLVGEAYFEVAKNPKLPFIVHAANIKVKAIGTAFNVKAYPEENSVETTLVHGLVEVEKTGQPDRIYLKPNQKVVLTTNLQDNIAKKKLDNPDANKNSPSSKSVSNETDRLIPKIDTEKETSWKEGKLIFDREPLSALVIKLGRRYDVHFTFSSEELKNYIYTGTFNDVSLEQILEAMHYSSPIDYVIKEKEVKIMEKNNYK